MTAEAQIELLRTALSELLDVAQKCDGWEFFPQAALDRANDVLMATPEGAVAELKANAIMSTITDELYRRVKPLGGKDCVIEVEEYLTECADKIRGEAQ